MANMAYGRFSNTLQDLRDCFENWEENISQEEQNAQMKLLRLCKKIVAEYGEEQPK